MAASQDWNAANGNILIVWSYEGSDKKALKVLKCNHFVVSLSNIVLANVLFCLTAHHDILFVASVF